MTTRISHPHLTQLSKGKQTKARKVLAEIPAAGADLTIITDVHGSIVGDMHEAGILRYVMGDRPDGQSSVYVTDPATGGE